MATLEIPKPNWSGKVSMTASTAWITRLCFLFQHHRKAMHLYHTTYRTCATSRWPFQAMSSAGSWTTLHRKSSAACSSPAKSSPACHPTRSTSLLKSCSPSTTRLDFVVTVPMTAVLSRPQMFASRVFDIRCVLEVIREGQAALVTSFSCFKYMSLYSAIQFTSVSFLYAKASNLGDFQFLFIDLVLILPLAIFMGWSGPAQKLHRKRPTADLVSRKVLTPLLGLMAICVAIQAVAYVAVREQPWYKPPKLKHEGSNIKNSENTALFLMSCFEYTFAAVILNAGPPFRARTAKNWPFTLTVLLALAVVLYMVLGPAHWLKKLMQLSYMSSSYELLLIGLGVLFLGLGWTFETMVAGKLARAIGRWNLKLSGAVKQRKKYKTI